MNTEFPIISDPHTISRKKNQTSALAVPPLATAQSDRPFRAARSGPRTPYLVCTSYSKSLAGITLSDNPAVDGRNERGGWARLRGDIEAGAQPGKGRHARGDRKLAKERSAKREALRKYTYGAGSNGETVHASAKQWRLAKNSAILLREETRVAKWCLSVR
eukprot:6190175-Pleurochrysis_carterae.AAC.1